MSREVLCVGGPTNGRHFNHGGATLVVPDVPERVAAYFQLGPLPPTETVRTFTYRRAIISTDGLARHYWIPKDIEAGEELNYVFGRFEAAVVVQGAP